MKPIRHIAEILEPSMDKTSKTVEWEMTKLLDWVRLSYTEENDLEIEMDAATSGRSRAMPLLEAVCR